jgi:hypothetical protein
MSASNLTRLGALAAMVGGVLFLAGSFVLLVGHPFLYLLGFPVRDYPVLYVLYGVSSVVALLLVPVGMVGFHVLQRHSYGREALFGFWLVVVGALVAVLGGVVFVTLGKWGDVLQASPPLVWVALGLLGLVVGLVSLVVGFALYGVATLQAKVLPRWCGVAVIAALPVALALSVSLHFSSMFLVFGLAWLALGYTLWTRRNTTAGHPSRVR